MYPPSSFLILSFKSSLYETQIWWRSCERNPKPVALAPLSVPVPHSRRLLHKFGPSTKKTNTMIRFPSFLGLLYNFSTRGRENKLRCGRVGELTNSGIWVVECNLLVDLAPIGFGEVGFDSSPGHHIHTILGMVERLKHGYEC